MSAETVSKGGRSHVAWNKGRLVGQKRPLRPKEVWTIRVGLQMKHSNLSAISRCSIWLSTASIAAATSSPSGSTTSRPAVP